MKVVSNLQVGNQGYVVSKNNINNGCRVSRIKYDLFYKSNNIAFLGINKKCSETDVKIVKKAINNPNWKSQAYLKEYRKLIKNRPLKVVAAHHGYGEQNLDMNDPIERVIRGVFTLGISEIEIQLENKKFRRQAREKTDELELILTDLLIQKANEEAMDALKTKDNARSNLEYLSELNHVKEFEIQPKLLNKIQARREGINTEIPNCVMFSNPNDELNQELIQWTMSQANANAFEIDCKDKSVDLIEILEDAEENYQSSGYWNLIYVKGLDKLINPSEADFDCIEGMKSMMCSTAKDYHTTLLFSSIKPEDLDDTAIETNRVLKIDTSNLSTPNALLKDAAKKRLENSKYAIETPISAINDLLTIIDCEDSENYKLNFDSTKVQMTETQNYISKQLNNRDLEGYIPALATACQSAWFIT